MAKQYLSSQEILFRCFEDKTGQLRTSNGPYALQDYLNAVFDENTNSLRISSVVNSIVVPSEKLSLLVAPEDGQLIKLTTEDDDPDFVAMRQALELDVNAEAILAACKLEG